MVHTAHRSHEAALLLGHPHGKMTNVEPEAAGHNVGEAAQLVQWVEALEKARIEATRQSEGNLTPRLVRLAERYELGDKSLNLFQLLVVSMSVTTIALNSVLQEYSDDYGARLSDTHFQN